MFKTKIFFMVASQMLKLERNMLKLIHNAQMHLYSMIFYNVKNEWQKGQFDVIKSLPFKS